ncbi:MAG: porin family protein [Muribaculaceae bacterium]|nr:porin family protein [Muribaculaceae bacterium]
MRKIFVIICVAVLGIASAHAEKGQKGLGFNVNYGTEIENFGLGAKFQYFFTDNLRGEASFNYFFKKNNYSMWDLNADIHYLFNVSDRFHLYPILGLTLANANPEGFDSTTKFGANIGGGAEFDIAHDLSVNFQVRYSAVSKIDQAVISLGATYKF